MRTPVFFIALVISAAGCAPKSSPLPEYPPMSDEQTLQVLASRARAVRNVSAEALLTLTQPDGESVRLDAALVMAPPNRMRLRAWKLSQAVFDLTLTPDGVWLITPENSSRKEQIRSAGLNAAQLARTWSLLMGSFFDAKGLVIERGDNALLIKRAAENQTQLWCEVKQETLTVLQYRLVDSSGAIRFTLEFDNYTARGDVIWPQRIVATSDRGKIEIDVRDLEINGELSPGAFVPPRRAEKLP